MRGLNERVHADLARLLASAEPGQRKLDAALRVLCKWRSHLLQAELVRRHGVEVLSGPFRGMSYLAASREGCHIPKLLGCYEAELHPAIEQAAARGYRHVINIGSAEGYYAVGFARRLPAARIGAFDTDPLAQDACRALAAKNGVADRIEVGGSFRQEEFARYSGESALVFCDIEGAELQLLDPKAAPALAGMDLIVECHDCFNPAISPALAERFAATHEVELVRQSGRDAALPEMFAPLSELDRLIAVWEWRSGPTPWLVLRSRRPP